MRTRDRASWILGLSLLGLAALALGCAVRVALPGLAPPVAVADEATGEKPASDAPAEEATPAPADEVAPVTTAAALERPLPQAVAEMYKVTGQVRGKVLIGPREVLRTSRSQNGIEPYERATLAAARVNLSLAEGVKADEFRATQQGEQWLVVARDRLIISPDPQEAQDAKVTLKALTERWATNISLAIHEALGTKPGGGPLPPIQVEVRKITVAGAEVGVLYVHGTEVLRLTTSTAGFTPVERAGIVADRLRRAVAEGALPRDFRAGEVGGVWMVQVADLVLVTADDEEGRRAGMSAGNLAQGWAEHLAMAVSSYYANAGVPTAPLAADLQAEEEYDDKWVPIVSVLEGIKLGIARVNGPRSKVKLVQAVAQLETHWRDYVEIDVYVPISTRIPGENTLDRVEGCAVTGLGDIKL